jgi:hypothetical protein
MDEKITKRMAQVQRSSRKPVKIKGIGSMSGRLGGF